MGQLQVVAIRDTDAVLPREHPLIAFEQQRFSFGIFRLSSQAGAQQALGAEPLPVIRLLLLVCFECFARQRLALSKFLLRNIDQRQLGHRGHRIRVFHAQSVPAPGQGLRGIISARA